MRVGQIERSPLGLSHCGGFHRDVVAVGSFSLVRLARIHGLPLSEGIKLTPWVGLQPALVPSWHRGA